MKTPDDLYAAARRLRIASLTGIVLLVLILAYGVVATLTGKTSPAAGFSFYLGAQSPIAHWAAFATLVVTMTPLGLALWRLAQMLAIIERGEIFSRAMIARFRGFAFFLVAAAGLSMLAPIAMNFFLYAVVGGNVEQLAVRIDGRDVFMLFVSGLLFFVAKLLGEGKRLADDVRQII